MTPERFRDQLRRIASQGRRGVTFAEAASGGGPLVAVTFDDAFASVARWAEPVLDELGWPATVFVPTRAVDRGERLLWLADGHAGAEFDPLSWEEIVRLAAKGWQIGSHSCTHRRLSLLEDDVLRAELVGSREAIVSRVGACQAISYPWGELDDRVVEAARTAGYTSGSGLVGRFVDGDPMRIARYPVSAADGRLRFGFKTSPLGWRVRRSALWPALERGRAVAQGAHAAATRVGPATTARKVGGRVWSTRHSIGLACVPGLHPRAAPPAGLTIEVADPRALVDLPRLMLESSSEDYLFLRAMERTRLAAAGELVVARTADGEVAGMHFVHLPPHRRALEHVAPGLYPPLAEGEALTEAVFVPGPMRGSGVASAMLSDSLDRLAVAGCVRAMAYVDVTNRASLRTFARLGYTPFGEMRVDAFRAGRLSSTFAPATPAVTRAWDDTL